MLKARNPFSLDLIGEMPLRNWSFADTWLDQAVNLHRDHSKWLPDHERIAIPEKAAGLRLLADIGGTKARFALARRGEAPYAFRVLRTKDFAGPAQAIAAYLRLEGGEQVPATSALAVAGPILGDAVIFTNASWTFSVNELRRKSGVRDLVVLNDFEALAWALPSFGPTGVVKFGQGQAVKGAPRVVFGPGTGLGAGCYFPETDHALATEAGHINLAASTAREAEVIAVLAERFGHVSVERVVSGPGLRHVYEALSKIDRAPPLDPDVFGVGAITRRAREGVDPLATETVKIFCALAGSFAGDLALAYGARGGVYLGGGVIPRLGSMFDLRMFRQRFIDKGRFQGWLARIPTYLVTHPKQTMVGLAHFLDRRDAGAGLIRDRYVPRPAPVLPGPGAPPPPQAAGYA